MAKGLVGVRRSKCSWGWGTPIPGGEFKFNLARSDTMIIHVIVLLDQMDRDLNTFAVRVKI